MTECRPAVLLIQKNKTSGRPKNREEESDAKHGVKAQAYKKNRKRPRNGLWKKRNG